MRRMQTLVGIACLLKGPAMLTPPDAAATPATFTAYTYLRQPFQTEVRTTDSPDPAVADDPHVLKFHRTGRPQSQGGLTERDQGRGLRLFSYTTARSARPLSPVVSGCTSPP
jgi:hypothetical protein